MIEMPKYETIQVPNSMSIQIVDEELKKDFWSKATKYVKSGKQDEAFLNEMAYMMVTLHRTGN